MNTAALSALFAWLLASADLINLAAAILIVAAALVVWLRKPPILRQHDFAVHALGFWIFQWITFFFIYTLLYFRMGVAGIPVLVLVDLQSVLAVGFFMAFWLGDGFRPAPVWIGVVVIAATFGFLDVFLGLLAADTPAGSTWRRAWIAPSEVLSATALIMLGGSFVLRLGMIALWMLVATTLYAIFQRPVYEDAFVELTREPRWFLLLGFWKILIGALFYLYFLAPLEKYQSIRVPPVSAAVRRHVKTWLKRTGYALGPIVAFVVEELIRSTFLR